MKENEKQIQYSIIIFNAILFEHRLLQICMKYNSLEFQREREREGRIRTNIPVEFCNCKAGLSKAVCSVRVLEDATDALLVLTAAILWMVGGLTMVIGMSPSSVGRPFVSLGSWHRAHQCVQQCTRQGSHGEFYRSSEQYKICRQT